MTASHKRRHDRLKHRANIRVVANENQDINLVMRDLSDSGLYLLCDDTSIVKSGDIVEVQTLEIDDAPILPSIVRRIEENIGFAVEFILD